MIFFLPVIVRFMFRFPAFVLTLVICGHLIGPGNEEFKEKEGAEETEFVLRIHEREAIREAQRPLLSRQQVYQRDVKTALDAYEALAFPYKKRKLYLIHCQIALKDKPNVSPDGGRKS